MNHFFMITAFSYTLSLMLCKVRCHLFYLFNHVYMYLLAKNEFVYMFEVCKNCSYVTKSRILVQIDLILICVIYFNKISSFKTSLFKSNVFSFTVYSKVF